MDINSIQSFGAVNSYGGQTESSSSVFNDMLEDMLNSSSSNASGSLFGTMAMPDNSLQYAGINRVFQPSTLSSVLAAPKQFTHASTTGVTSNYSGQYENIIREAAEQYNLPDQLISAVIQHESNFNNNSVSRAGAEGLMQLMPGTAKFLGVTDSFNPAQNIKGGANYLRQMLNQFSGDIEHALAAYNAGPGNVRKYGGIPPFKETQNYVKNVLNTFRS